MTTAAAPPDIHIRPARTGDSDAIWRVVEPVIRAGETWPLPRDWQRDEALAYWFAPAHEVFVAELEGAVAGTYYLRANQPGAGSHVANCGYMTRPDARGRGVGSAMCAHSMRRAAARGFAAMQFNLVVATNTGALALWQRHGMAIAGTLTGAFDHPLHGRVDAHVMYRLLDPGIADGGP